MTLLCIDDDVEDLALISEAIKTINPEYTCLMTTDCDEGLSLVSALHPAIIFLDINMPKKDGAEVLRLIRLDKSLQDVKICILSTSITRAGAEKYLQMGANYCIQKANSFKELRHALKSLLEQFIGVND